MDMEKCFIITVVYMKDIGKIIKKKDLVFITISTKQNTSAISKKI